MTAQRVRRRPLVSRRSAGAAIGVLLCALTFAALPTAVFSALGGAPAAAQTFSPDPPLPPGDQETARQSVSAQGFGALGKDPVREAG